ncbi:MAG: HSP20-like chaperone [Monoraphidium minutum]|nr:MAG: HSP20-like chaperone [Monoraphidium minutum]
MALNPWFGGGGMMDFPFGRATWGGRDPLDFGGLLPSLSAAAPAVSTHPLDVIEMPDAFKITIDTPGMDAGDINITMQDGVMTISGRKKSDVEEKDKEGRVLRRERAFSSFSRSFTMPDNVREDAIGARLHNGVLSVTVPKTEPPPKAEPKRIMIETAGGGGGEVPKVTHAPHGVHEGHHHATTS